MKTIAAVLEDIKKPLSILELDVPSINPGQVLVEIEFSGVCHSQLMEARGYRGKDKFLPHLLGHEGTGTVVQIGIGVTKVKIGNKVILGWIKAEGMDVPGTRYHRGNEVVNAGGVTTFSTLSVVSENRCVLIPEGIPMDVAVLFGCAIPTGAGMVINHVKPNQGSSIAIFGLGGIGMSALMATRLFKCSKVIAIDIEDSKLEMAREFGATQTINSSRQNTIETIRELTNGSGVDFSIEAAGLTTTIETAFQAVRKSGGLCVFASHPKNGDHISIDPYDLICGKRIEGSWGGESKPDRDIPLIAELYRNGQLPLEKLLSRRYSLAQINEAFDDLENRRIVRAIIDMKQTQQIN